jgi:hypothetical protein
MFIFAIFTQQIIAQNRCAQLKKKENEKETNNISLNNNNKYNRLRSITRGNKQEKDRRIN